MKYLDTISSFISLSGFPLLIRKLLYRNAITILVYHDPSPEVFELHISWLKKNYTCVSLSKAISALKEGKVEQLGKYPLVITIDDGRKGNYKLLPVIKKYNIKPIIYICSKLINSNRMLWDDFLAVNNINSTQHLKTMTEGKRRAYLENNYSYSYETDFPLRTMMNINELKEMECYVEIGSHGCFHQPLSSLTTDELKSEVNLSKNEIDSFADKECLHFSYPSGMYDKKSREILKKSKYLSVRSTDVGRNMKKDDCQLLKVTGVSDDASLAKLNVQSIGLFRFIKSFQIKLSIRFI